MSPEFLLLLLLFAADAGHGSTEDAAAADMTTIYFCHSPLPQIIRDGNASFNVVFSFEVNEDRRPQDIVKLMGKYVDDAFIEKCISQWKLPEDSVGDKMFFSSYWRHGFGWEEMTVSGPNFNQRIVRFGELSPYG